MKLRNKKTGDIGFCKFHIVHSSPNAPLYYYSLREVLEDWEDYEPEEPLIKDENIRKAVMSLPYEKLKFEKRDDKWVVFDGEPNLHRKLVGGLEIIILQEPFKGCEIGRTYSHEELCGEEECEN